MECQKSNVKITPTNWSKHVRTLKHLKNDPDQIIQLRRRGRPKTKPVPDQTIQLRRRGRPKTKPDPDQTIQPRIRGRPKTVNNVTRKDLLSQAI